VAIFFNVNSKIYWSCRICGYASGKRRRRQMSINQCSTGSVSDLSFDQ
jgi:hypothetical protein